MTKLGIIPAAGKATRFCGLFKELMPIGEGVTLLSNAVDRLESIPVDSVLVVTSHYKIAAHSLALSSRAVKYAVQRNYESDAWGAVQESFDCAGDWNYYLMPDTVLKVNIPEPQSDFTLGVFATYKPERFGVMDGGRIVAGLLPDSLAYQWSRLEPFGMFILVALLVTGLFSAWLGPLVDVTLKALYSVFGF